ncbi:MAG: hypothetical protein QM503_08650 [Bacteroidota bacterium]
MKKLIVLFTLILLIGITVTSQNISELYNNETIKLEAINGYGELNNWEDVFSPPPKEWSFDKSLGEQKQIVVAPDGSVFMSHKTSHEIWKFDAEGNFVNKFGQKGSRPGQFPMLPKVEGILDGKYIFTSDVNGRIQFFDFNGKYIKTLLLDYMPLDVRSLGNSKIAILGHVPWKNRHTKRIIAIKDFNSGDEKIIWSQLKDNRRGKMLIELSNGTLMNLSIPGTYPWPRLASSKSGNLIAAFPDDGHVSIYSPEGDEIKSFRLNIDPIKIEQEDIDDYYNAGKSNIGRFEERLKKAGNFSNEEIEDMVSQYKMQIGKLKYEDIYPDHLPYFANIMVDSDGNILVFEYTEKKNKKSNIFRVYSYDLSGKYLNRSSFVSDEYKLHFSSHSFIFHDNYIINIAKKKEGSGNLMRLVKFSIVE